ncbi:hypothetical protein [Amycolatopsis thermoflava]|uniref:hypothetical protein n=1 Tax=Amycolatopsis thermoflava TaxID=84480 RepID=UPI00382E1271
MNAKHQQTGEMRYFENEDHARRVLGDDIENWELIPWRGWQWGGPAELLPDEQGRLPGTPGHNPDYRRRSPKKVARRTHG